VLNGKAPYRVLPGPGQDPIGVQGLHEGEAAVLQRHPRGGDPRLQPKVSGDGKREGRSRQGVPETTSRSKAESETSGREQEIREDGKGKGVSEAGDAEMGDIPAGQTDTPTEVAQAVRPTQGGYGRSVAGSLDGDRREAERQMPLLPEEAKDDGGPRDPAEQRRDSRPDEHRRVVQAVQLPEEGSDRGT